MVSKKSTSAAPRTPRSQTDWKKVDALRDDEIDTSDIPPLSPDDFADAIVREGLKPIAKKRQITLRLDEDVIAWFKQRGSGYQTRINEVLRAYVEASKKSAE